MYLLTFFKNLLSRGIRKAYKETFLTEMMADAFKQWHDLENESETSLMKYVMIIKNIN